MKRLFTCAIIAMIASLAFAQAPVAQKAAAKGFEKVLVSTSAAQQVAEKAAAAQTTSASVFRRAGRTAVGQSLLSPVAIATVTGRESAAMTVGTQYATTQDGNLTVTTDANGIITDVTGGTEKCYTRTGTAYYVSSGTTYPGDQSGMAVTVEDGNTIYFKNPISRYTQGSWVKGVKNGNTITIATHQPLAYSSTYGATISLRWGVVDASGSIAAADSHAEAFTFAVNGDVLTLEGTQSFATANGADAFFMGAFWDDDNSATGYGDAETVLTYDAGYVPPSTTLVTLPEGAVAENWFLNGTQVTSSSTTAIKNQAAKVAIVGSDVYVAGLSLSFPNSWMKGTISGTTVEFENFQYSGAYQGSVDTWFMGYNETSQAICAPVATYDVAAKTLTFTVSVLTNGATDRVYYLDWVRDAVVSATEKEIEEPVLTDLTAELPYVNTFDTAEEQNEVAIYDANEDGKTFTFASDSQSGSTAARYTYHSSNQANDYLVFPGVQLEAGKSYKVTVDARANGTSFPERVEVVAGKVAKESALNIQVIEPTTLSGNTYDNGHLANTDFQVSENGTYYFAVHAISDPDMFYMFVDNFAVQANDDSAPAAVSDIAIVADPTGANKATITFTMPSANLAGEALTGDVNVVVKRDGEEILNAVKAAGSTVTIEDEVAAPGTYTYTFLTSVGDHVGELASAKAYIGEDVPNPVEALTIADKSGAVALDWEAPTTGENDGIIVVEHLTYNVYPVELEDFLGIITIPVADKEHPYLTGLTATEATVDFATNEGEHQYTYFAVAAENAAGEGDEAITAVLTGAPYSLPVRETLAGGSLTYWWGYSTTASEDSESGLYLGAETVSGDESRKSFDMYADEACQVSMMSGKIALAGATNPVLSFAHKLVGEGATLTVVIVTKDGETAVKTITPGTDWAAETISLSAYASADWIRFYIVGTFGEGENDVYFDNVKVVNQLENNLAVAKIQAPSKVKGGEDITVAVTVENQGSAAVAAGAYTVELKNEGEVIATQEGTALEADALATFTFTVATTPVEAKTFALKANIAFAADQEVENNESAEVAVATELGKLPNVVDLAGALVTEGVKLTWSEPNLDGAAETVTEDFEDAESFALEVEGWTIIDNDGQDIGGIEGIDLGVSKAGWFVFDNSDESKFNQSFAGHSGNKFLSNMYLKSGAACSDWAISPELTGAEQTISFWAKSYTANYGLETIEVYYGNGTTVDAFPATNKLLTQQLPDEWTEYSVTIPAGASHFAIVCVSADIFMAFVDDVTFEKASTTSNLSLVGYDIYRDGVKVNAEPVAETSFVDTAATEGAHVYHVIVNYNKGISAPSNAAEVNVTGLASLAKKLSVVAAEGAIVVKGAEGQEVVISAVNGTVVNAGIATANTKVNVASGVYLVKVGKTVVKVIVK